MASNIRVVLELDNKSYIANIKTAKEQTESFAKSADKAGERANKNFSKIGDSASIALGKLKSLAATYIGIATIKSSLGFAAELDALSKATDVSIPKLIALEQAIATAGGQSNKAGDFVSELQKKLYEAGQGSAEAQEGFMKLGFSLRDMGNLTPEQALQKTINSLAGMENATQRNAVAQKLLGDAAKNIDWNQVATSYEANKDAATGFAVAAQKSARIMAEIETSFRDVKIAITLLLEPLLDLYKYVSQLVGGAGGGVFKALAFLVKGVAIGIATLSTAVNNVVTDLKTLIDLAPAVWARDWDKAGEIIENRNKSIQDSTQRLVDYINKQDLFGQAPPVPETPEPPKKAPAGTNIAAYYAKEVEALSKLSDAYAQINSDIATNIRIDTLKLREGEDSIAMMDAMTKTTEDYNKAITDLNNKLAQEQAGPETEASRAKIAQLKEEIAQVSALHDEQQRRIPELIRKRQQELSISKAITIQADLQREAFGRAVDTQAELNKIGKSPLEKQMIDIKAATDKTVQSLIDLEAQRRFGLDYIIKKDQFIDPATGAYLNKSMEEFRQKIISVYKTKEEQEKADLSRVTDAQRTWSAGWKEAFAAYVDDATNTAKQATALFNKFASGFEDAIVNFVKTGKLSFKDLANTIIEEFVRIQAKKLFLGIFGGDQGGGLSDIFKALVGRANGGPIMANTPYIVGERGPELFMPRTAGSIVPNNQLAMAGNAGTSNVTYNINAVDAASFRQMLAREPEFLYAVTQKGASSIPGGRR